LSLLEDGIRVPFDVDVSDVVPFPGPHVLRGWLLAPRGIDPVARQVVYFCLPGGRCTTSYFDLRPEGIGGYSMAEYLVERGQVVVAFDHLGVGTSSEVEDIFLVTPWVAAAANDKAHRFVLEALHTGTVDPGLPALKDVMSISVGHSMGGMLGCIQQAHHGRFDALAGFGHGGDGLPDFLTQEEMSWTSEDPDAESRLIDLTRRRAESAAQASRRLVPGSFLPRDLADEVRVAYVEQQTDLLLSCGLMSMIPGGTDSEKAQITIPVFLAFGDHDLTTNPAGSVAHYTASPDVTLFVLADSAHCHNQAPTRHQLWSRLRGWVGSLEATP
jgi:pimeloyl-ACP methyl ester carboxylesterase